MKKKKRIIILILYVSTFLLVGCGRDYKKNTIKNTIENLTQQQTTTENNVTTTEKFVTTESINQLQMDSMANPLQFGNVVTIHTEYMPNPIDIYELETEISITNYENEYISCDVKLINITPYEGSNENQDIYFDSNFLIFTLYDENYIPIDYGYPISNSDGATHGESNILIQNQILKGQIGPLKGSYDGAIPKYISFEYAREYSEHNYIPYYVYYEIPDGLFDTSYTPPVDMSVMGTDSAEQALELFWECVKNEDVELAKKISFTYYIRFQKSGREMFVTPTWNEYLNIVGYKWPDYPAVQTEEVINGFKGICENPDEWLEDNIVEDVETLASYERRIYDLFGINCVIQASLRYEYSYSGVYVIEVDNRWFVVSYSSWWDDYTYQ